ncbi:MAG: type II secretion system protein F [Actinobacteria bacterium]|nr:type II secretion system protein F [Actinomycetota bacterium]
MNLVALFAALGLLLLYNGITVPPGHHRSRFVTRLEERSIDAGFPGLSAPKLLTGLVVAALSAFVLATGLTSSTAIGIAGAVLGSTIPLSFLRARSQRRRRLFRDAWPDALASLIASVRAGVSLPESCSALAERGPTELRNGFQALLSTYRSTGSFPNGIHSLTRTLADPIADRVGASLLLAHEVGGSDLVRVLRTTSDFVLEDARIRKEIEARWSWTVTAARVAAAAPWVVLIMMATRPEAARAYDSPSGMLVIAGGGMATFVGYRMMLRAARLPEERRLS